MSEIYTLKNECLTLSVCSLGAEMRSLFFQETGKEQLWQRDPAVWNNCAPWLFPIVGQLKEGCYFWRGQAYSMPMHGFASAKEFTLEERNAAALRLVLRADEETLALYPFTFRLEITYTLCGPCLHIGCRVRHERKEEMYFSLGAHPGFLCGPGDRLVFSNPAEPMQCRRLESVSHLLCREIEQLGKTPREIVLRESLFERDAILMEHPISQSVRLLRQDQTGVDFRFGSVPWLGIWSRAKPPLRYVCIEPWHGVDDSVDAAGELAGKEGIQYLAPEEEFTWNLTIKPFAPHQHGEKIG